MRTTIRADFFKNIEFRGCLGVFIARLAECVVVDDPGVPRVTRISENTLVERGRWTPHPFLIFFPGTMGFYQVLLNIGRHRVVMTEFHRVGTLALRQTFQFRMVIR
jgi:hypothetical protein